MSTNLCQIHRTLVLSSKTDFFVDMSGQISSRRRQLSTKQWSGNKCSDVSDQNPNFKLRDGSSVLARETVVGWVSSMPLHSLDSVLFANSQAFLMAYFIYILFLKCRLSFLFQNSTRLCRQNRIFVDMSYLLKIAVLSPILLKSTCWRQHYRTLHLAFIPPFDFHGICCISSCKPVFNWCKFLFSN